MARITERELILPSLFIINQRDDKKINTTELIEELRKLLNPDGEDLEILNFRNDDKFSQKVRNLRAHRTLERNNYTEYRDNFFYITPDGVNYLDQNKEELQNIINTEKFLNKNSGKIDNYFEEFDLSINRIKELSETEIGNDENKKHFLNLLYSSVITTLETYLSDALRYNINNEINEDKIYYKHFIGTLNLSNSDNKEQVLNMCDNIGELVEEKLLKISFHNLKQVKDIYKNTFYKEILLENGNKSKEYLVDIGNIGDLMDSIDIRHDLVHRNGKKRNGENHDITKNDILELSEKILEFVKNIENQFQNLG